MPARLRRLDFSEATGLLLVLLAAASDVKVRTRDPYAALENVTDAQILVELAVWGMVGAWVAWRLARQEREVATTFPARLGPVTRALALLAAAVLLSALYRGSLFSLTRAVQFTVLFLVVVVVAEGARVGRVDLQRWWRWWRRGLWGLVLVLTAVSAVPGTTDPATIYEGIGRYRWLAMHPIATATLLAVALILLVATFYGLPDPLFGRRAGRLLRWGMLGGFSVLLLLTRARGPLFAAVAATALLIFLSEPGRRRAGAVILLGWGVVVVSLGAGVDVLADSVLRGQTFDQLVALSGRDDIYSEAWPLFQERPVFGFGYLSGRSVFLERIRWAPGESHSVIVDIAMSMGTIGFLLWGWLLWRLFGMLLRAVTRRGSTPEQALGREALALAAFPVILGITSDTFAGPVGLEPVVLASACVVADGLRRGRAGTAALSRPRAPAA